MQELKLEIYGFSKVYILLLWLLLLLYSNDNTHYFAATSLAFLKNKHHLSAQFIFIQEVCNVEVFLCFYLVTVFPEFACFFPGWIAPKTFPNVYSIYCIRFGYLWHNPFCLFPVYCLLINKWDSSARLPICWRLSYFLILSSYSRQCHDKIQWWSNFWSFIRTPLSIWTFHVLSFKTPRGLG